MSNLTLVQTIYGLLAQGDLDAVLEYLSDDIRLDVWDPPSDAQATLPYTQPRHGKVEMISAQQALAGLEVHSLEPMNFLFGGDQVAVLLRVDATVKSTSKRFQDLEFHLWTVGDNGKITEMRHVIDTAKQVAAHQP